MADKKIIKEELVPAMSMADLQAARDGLRRVLGAVERRMNESSQSDRVTGMVSREDARQILQKMREG